jgi:hypothetical protein
MVNNMARSFYVNGVGFEIEDEWRPSGQLKWCMLRLDKTRFMLQEHDPDQAPGTMGAGVRMRVFCDDPGALLYVRGPWHHRTGTVCR